MSALTIQQREKLDGLWETILSNEMDKHLAEDGIVTDGFLLENRIAVSRVLLHRYPIDPDRYECPERRLDWLEYGEYVPGSRNSRRPVLSRTENLVRYLNKWCFGGYPRRLPEGFHSLARLRGISPVSIPNPLLWSDGYDTAGYRPGGEWETFVYEFEREGEPHVYPHVTLLSSQAYNGHDGTIMLGELAPIVTAMRSRAVQPQTTNEELEKVQEDDPLIPPGFPLKNPNPIFGDEERFPVLMVSLVGPQHGRIYYACMDGTDLIIRQSKLYNFERRECAPLDLMASILLSRRCEEPKEPP